MLVPQFLLFPRYPDPIKEISQGKPQDQPLLLLSARHLLHGGFAGRGHHLQVPFGVHFHVEVCPDGQFQHLGGRAVPGEEKEAGAQGLILIQLTPAPLLPQADVSSWM